MALAILSELDLPARQSEVGLVFSLESFRSNLVHDSQRKALCTWLGGAGGKLLKYLYQSTHSANARTAEYEYGAYGSSWAHSQKRRYEAALGATHYLFLALEAAGCHLVVELQWVVSA